ncbi:MAG: CpsB/CapC family capsule biosynthesis tyrosine phosphatase [Solirubrobacterales bacterium]
MIDLHIHLLPGIDDGPADLDGALALANAVRADGVTAVAATPHVNEAHRTTAATMRDALASLRAGLAGAGLAIDVHGGAEIAIDRLDRLSDDDLRGFSLGGSGRYLLLECPYAGWPMDLELHTGRIAQLGMRPLLAHPERSAAVQGSGGAERLRDAVDRGLLVQITAGSLSGHHGRTAAETARRLIDEELVHVISSDAHSADRRPPRMSEAFAAIGDDVLARWLTTAAPGAILRGERLPERPRRRASRGDPRRILTRRPAASRSPGSRHRPATP